MYEYGSASEQRKVSSEDSIAHLHRSANILL